MNTYITVNEILKNIKTQNKPLSLLLFQHYGKVLKTHGKYKKINEALNDISKKLGYRKFGDLKLKLEERGTIVDFIFKISVIPTLEMPYYLDLHCELYLDSTYNELLQNNEKPYLVVERDSIYIQYSDNKILDSFVFSFKYNAKNEVFFNEDCVVEFKEALVPKTIEDLYNVLNKNYEENQSIIEYNKNENKSFLFNSPLFILIKPKNKKEYKASIDIFDSLSKQLDIDMSISFGDFNSKDEAEYFSSVAKAYFVNKGNESKIRITSRGKQWFATDNDIVFRRIKKQKKEVMGKPLNPMDNKSFEIIKDSLNPESPYYEKYYIDSENDLEVFDCSLNELSKEVRDNFSFQVLSYSALKIE